MPPHEPRPDGGDRSGGFSVDVPSVQEASRRLRDLGLAVVAAHTAVDSTLSDCRFAFAPSDLKMAFDYCAVRWSEHLDTAEAELTRAGDATVRAGEVYRDTDRLPGRGRTVPR